MQKRWAAFVAAGSLAFVGVTVASPREAQAQMADPCVAAGGGSVCRMNALPQGTIGGALLGMELVMIIEGAAGVRNPWIMLGTGLAGGIAGGVGGYFLDQALDAPGQPQGMTAISTAMLAVGLGLVIPTAIVFTGATMYRPPDAQQQQQDDTQGAALEESGTTNAGGAPPGGAGSAADPNQQAPTTRSSGSTSTGPASGPSSSIAPTRRARALVAARAVMGAPGLVRPSLLNFGAQGWSLGVPAVGLTSRSTGEGQAPASEWRISLVSGAF